MTFSANVRAESVFTLIDLIEYENLQEELVAWAKENNYPYKMERSIREEIEIYENDERFTVIYIYSKDKRHAFWITTEDIDLIADKRKETPSYNPTTEVWVSEYNEDDGEYYDGFDLEEYCEIDVNDVILSITHILKTLNEKNDCK